MYNMYNSFFSIIVAAVLLFFAFFAFHGLNSWEDESEERFERRKGQVKRFLIERIGSAILAIAFFAAMMYFTLAAFNSQTSEGLKYFLLVLFSGLASLGCGFWFLCALKWRMIIYDDGATYRSLFSIERMFSYDRSVVREKKIGAQFVYCGIVVCRLSLKFPGAKKLCDAIAERRLTHPKLPDPIC